LAEALIICRFLHFGAAMLLFGTSTFSGVLAPIGFGPRLERAFARPQAGLVLLLVITTVAWLLLETAEIGDGWSDAVNPVTIWAVLTGTNFGGVWLVRLVLMLLPPAALLLPGRPRQLGLALASALLLASLGFVGHAADEDGWLGIAHRLNHAVHLLSGGFWVGCLPPLLFALFLLRDATLRQEAGAALRRYSSIGHVAVALVVLTGAINTAFILGGLPTDLSAPYQLLLVIKIALVAVMMGVAIFNRYVAVPRLSLSWGWRGIVTGTVVEIILGAAVVALVSAFATFDPMPGMDM